MGFLGRAALVIWHDIAAGCEADYIARIKESDTLMAA